MEQNKSDYIPALRYNWLTGVYDTVVKYTMPEQEFKTALILQANIKKMITCLILDVAHLRFR